MLKKKTHTFLILLAHPSRHTSFCLSQTWEAEVRDEVCGSALRIIQLTHLELAALKISLVNNHSEMFDCCCNNEITAPHSIKNKWALEKKKKKLRNNRNLVSACLIVKGREFIKLLLLTNDFLSVLQPWVCYSLFTLIQTHQRCYDG